MAGVLQPKPCTFPKHHSDALPHSICCSAFCSLPDLPHDKTQGLPLPLVAIVLQVGHPCCNCLPVISVAGWYQKVSKAQTGELQSRMLCPRKVRKLFPARKERIENLLQARPSIYSSYQELADTHVNKRERDFI